MSATSTPSKNAAPRTPTPRKKPHCTHCGLPMLGHKRGQCQSPLKSGASPKQKQEEDELETKMKALLISHKHSDDDEKKARAARRRSSFKPPPLAESILSLSSDDKATLEVLAQPGIMSDDIQEEENENGAKLKKWLDSVPAAPSPGRRKAPRSSEVVKLEMPVQALQELVDLTFPAKPRVASSALSRTESAVMRDEFVDDLEKKSKMSKSTVFRQRITESDVETLQAQAVKLKLHARAIVSSSEDREDGWLVLGMDFDSVEAVFERIKTDKQKETKGSLPRTLGSGAAGAVATWLILAYA